MNIAFSKISGAGNDFIVIDNRKRVIPDNEAEFIRKVCARRISAGADGLLLVEKSDVADFKMRYFNSDGSEAETCGNGARCIARFAYIEKVVTSEKMTFETKAGLYAAQIVGNNVKLQMSDTKDLRLGFPIALSDGAYEISFANSGVPHAVFFVDDLDGTDVFKIGRETRYDKDFEPRGTNANFISIVDENNFKIRTYERGVEDETLACGTGCIASAVVAGAYGKVKSPVNAHTQGGFTLRVYFDLKPGGAENVFLEGDARIIYKGFMLEEAWSY